MEFLKIEMDLRLILWYAVDNVQTEHWPVYRALLEIFFVHLGGKNELI